MSFIEYWISEYKEALEKAENILDRESRLLYYKHAVRCAKMLKDNNLEQEAMQRMELTC